MKDSFSMFVAGEPRAQERPRFSNRGGYVKAYDPESSRNHKAMIGMMAREVMGDRKPLEGDLILVLTVLKNPPMSWSKKKQRECLRRGILSKPDLDNYVKLVLDALNGVVFRDDKDVATILARKLWTDEQPGMRITVTVADYEEEIYEDQADT